ncbi:MAG: hypothetical protein IIX16_09590 [Clostridia bacterium]|nr:hypothetical protein [Clostridia bacterium]MBR0349870.1 hypothetical protein [Clostridia bacterium]
MKGLGILAIGIADVLLWVPIVFPFVEILKKEQNFKKIFKLLLIAFAIYIPVLLLFWLFDITELVDETLGRMVGVVLFFILTLVLKAIKSRK